MMRINKTRETITITTSLNNFISFEAQIDLPNSLKLKNSLLKVLTHFQTTKAWDKIFVTIGGR
jgi:hypothetical protein